MLQRQRKCTTITSIISRYQLAVTESHSISQGHNLRGFACQKSLVDFGNETDLGRDIAAGALAIRGTG